ncbi:hypothetical protein Droror1_Dr00017933, partial [Drosera rotundifolia]
MHETLTEARDQSHAQEMIQGVLDDLRKLLVENVEGDVVDVSESTEKAQEVEIGDKEVDDEEIEIDNDMQLIIKMRKKFGE